MSVARATQLVEEGIAAAKAGAVMCARTAFREATNGHGFGQMRTVSIPRANAASTGCAKVAPMPRSMGRKRTRTPALRVRQIASYLQYWTITSAGSSALPAESDTLCLAMPVQQLAVRSIRQFLQLGDPELH